MNTMFFWLLVIIFGQQRMASAYLYGQRVPAAAEFADFVVAGKPDFRLGVGGDEDFPDHLVATAAPVALNTAGNGLVGAAHGVETVDEGGLDQDFAVSGLQGADAAEVFILPEDEVAEEHDVVAGVHRRVGGVAVPQLPDSGGAVAYHIAPARVSVVGGEF